MTQYLEAITQAILVVGFAVASVRLWLLGARGTPVFRAFRWFAAVVLLFWTLFYVVAVLDFHHPDLVSAGFQQNFARVLQYFNLTIFLLWPVLADPKAERRNQGCVHEHQLEELRQALL